MRRSWTNKRSGSFWPQEVFGGRDHPLIEAAFDRHSRRKPAYSLQIARVCGKNCAGL